MYSVKRALTENASMLRELAIQTFEETYAQYNTREDMEAYMEISFSPYIVEEELLDSNTEFLLCFSDKIPIGYAKLNYNKPCEALPGIITTELQRIYVLKD